jgi:hypothetical protein
MTNDHGRTAVYRLYDAGGVLLYIGSSNNPPYRYSEHACSALKSSWWPQVTRKDETWYGKRTDAQEAEALAIRTEDPLHNLRLTANARNKAISMRFSETEAAEIDAARGAVSRSEFLRTACLAVARRGQGKPVRLIDVPPKTTLLPPRIPKNCRHVGMRLSKGVCPDCSEWVVK